MALTQHLEKETDGHLARGQQVPVRRKLPNFWQNTSRTPMLKIKLLDEAGLFPDGESLKRAEEEHKSLHGILLARYQKGDSWDGLLVDGEEYSLKTRESLGLLSKDRNGPYTLAN